MAGKCEDCNKPYVQFQATSTLVKENVFQTKRFYRCPKCGTVYVEVLEPKHLDFINGAEVIRVDKYPVRKEEKTTLDKWM